MNRLDAMHLFVRVAMKFLLDEFGTIGRLSAIAQAYGLMSGLQMCIWAFIQDLVQLRRDYSQDWESFHQQRRSRDLLSRSWTISRRITFQNFLAKEPSGTGTTGTTNTPTPASCSKRRKSERETENGFLIVRGYPLRYAPEAYFHNDFFRAVARKIPTSKDKNQPATCPLSSKR